MSNFKEWVGGYFEGKDSLRSFKIGDRKASPDEQNVLETENYLMVRNKEVYDENFDIWMQSVDWEELDKMVQEMIDGSGVKNKMVNNIWPGRVVNEQKKSNSMGEFELNGNYISLNNSLLKNIAGAADVSADILRTQVMFHEVVHAASRHENQVSYKSFKNSFDIFKEAFFEQFSVFRRTTTETLISSGNYHINKRKIHRDKLGEKVGEDDFSLFEFLNDAIVEKLSIEMLYEYAKRTGKFSQEELKKFESNYLNNNEMNPGVVYTVFMDFIIDSLANYSNVDKKLVWQGFKRGLFNEKPLEDNGVKEAFAGVLYPEFLEDLSIVQTSEDLLVLFKKIIQKNNQEQK